MYELTYRYTRVYRAISREKSTAPAASTRVLKARILEPKRIEKRFMRIIERISSPPAEPKDLKIIPDPTPIMIPARRALKSISYTGNEMEVHARAAEKIKSPAML